MNETPLPIGWGEGEIRKFIGLMLLRFGVWILLTQAAICSEIFFISTIARLAARM
jgi:hypothetical protein